MNPFRWDKGFRSVVRVALYVILAVIIITSSTLIVVTVMKKPNALPMPDYRYNLLQWRT